MAEILQIIRALGLYALVLAIALPNLWLLAKMLRVGGLAYVRNLEIFTFGMLACLPAFYLEVGLLQACDGWIQDWFYLPHSNTVERFWLKNLFVVAPVEEGFKALVFALALWRLRKLAPEHTLSPAAPVFWAALLAAGFASFENVLYARSH
jgi:RsiW-degrading membrane proteinase PrsW (M82 family)